jgi:hypothetical protein
MGCACLGSHIASERTGINQYISRFSKSAPLIISWTVVGEGCRLGRAGRVMTSPFRTWDEWHMWAARVHLRIAEGNTPLRLARGRDALVNLRPLTSPVFDRCRRARVFGGISRLSSGKATWQHAQQAACDLTVAMVVHQPGAAGADQPPQLPLAWPERCCLVRYDLDDTYVRCGNIATTVCHVAAVYGFDWTTSAAIVPACETCPHTLFRCGADAE